MAALGLTSDELVVLDLSDDEAAVVQVIRKLQRTRSRHGYAREMAKRAPWDGNLAEKAKALGLVVLAEQNRVQQLVSSLTAPDGRNDEHDDE